MRWARPKSGKPCRRDPGQAKKWVTLVGCVSAGSKQYVSFWADFNDTGTFETFLGTTSVNVYDIDSIPTEGLEYAVYLPVNLDKYRKPCYKGPKLVKIRAILSWQVPPPAWNPNYIPTWGNREETVIHIKPGVKPKPGIHTPIIQTVGSMSVDDINTSTGLASGPAQLAGFLADQSPFSGAVVITGKIANPPDISSGATPLNYKVEVSNNNGISWSTIDNPFTLHRQQWLNGIWSSLPSIVQTATNGWYNYQEDLTGLFGNAQIHPVGNVLARWNTNGLDGMYKLRITVRNPVTLSTFISPAVTVRLDKDGPATFLEITSGSGDCSDFSVGNVIRGNYTVADDYLNLLSFRVLPTQIGGIPSGGSFTSPASIPPSLSTMPIVRRHLGGLGVSTFGESGTWSLDTSGMRKCGYNIEFNRC